MPDDILNMIYDARYNGKITIGVARARKPVENHLRFIDIDTCYKNAKSHGMTCSAGLCLGRLVGSTHEVKGGCRVCPYKSF